MTNRLEFLDRAEFSVGSTYSFLPFFFERLDGSVLLTNDVGCFQILQESQFDDFVRRQLPESDPTYGDLKAKHFLSDPASSIHSRVLASHVRTRKAFLDDFSKLQIFVVSLRCDHSCPYCQVSRQSADRTRYDMSEEVAQKAVALALEMPSSFLTFEFQGGEALLNFEIIKFIVEYANERRAESVVFPH